MNFGRGVDRESWRAQPTGRVVPPSHERLRDGHGTRTIAEVSGLETAGPRALPDAESLRLLASVGVGRIVFSRYALPVIRPADHTVDDGAIIVYTGAGVAISPYQQVVAYEADTIDHHTGLGWCVIITGNAEPVTASDDLERYRTLASPRLSRSQPEHQRRIIRIHPDIITGIEYLDA